MDLEMPGLFRFLFEPKRTKVMFGGRAGLKSRAIAQALILKGAQQETRVLCAREFQGSIRESVHRLLSDTIARSGLGSFYDIQQRTIIGNNGTSFFFEGLRSNSQKIKSYEGIDIVWVEEADNTSEDSLEMLIPTIRKAGSELWFSFNPSDEMAATYQKYVAPYLDTILKDGVYEDSNIYVTKTSYEDADALGWFPDELRSEMELCKERYPNKFQHIWLGYPNTDFEDSIIQPEWLDAAIDAHVKLNFKPRGIKVIGFDVADSTTGDAKALTYRQGSVVNDVSSWHTGDMEEACERVYEFGYDERVNTIVYDNIGVGAGVKMKFKVLNTSEYPINIEGFSAAEMPSNKKYASDRQATDVFRNARAEMWWHVRDRFEATYRAVTTNEYIDPELLISLNGKMPELKMLKAELTRVQRVRSRNANNLIQVESKQDMRSRGLKSPDLADSLIMAFANKPLSIVNNKKVQPIKYSKRRNY